ncbi:MAG: glycosyltransferase family 2 protein [Verrucomicrobiota bacterium]|jgi:glycosyltransferase involved in cell wall biosynthesis
MEPPKQQNVATVANGDTEMSDYSKLPEKPLVSVWMTTYQHAPFIREALDSVLMQRVEFPYEICLGDDGSTDGTREICIDYSKRFPDKLRLFLRSRLNPVRKLHKFPGMHNAASTFNACRGKYIALLEGDDYWLHPHKLQTQVNVLESDPTLAACCHYAIAMQDGKPWFGGVTPEFAVDTVTVEGILKRDVTNLHTSTWMLRRGKPMQWEGFDSSLFIDYPMMVWTLLQGRGHVLPYIWSLYRYHPQAVFTTLSTEARLRENLELWKCLSSIVPQEMGGALSIGMSRTLTLYIGSLVRAGKYRLAWAHFRENVSKIANINCTAKERDRLRWLAIEAMLIPRLAGLRRRLKERQIM